MPHVEFCTQYFGTPFKIPFLGGWMVIVTSPDAIDDMRTRPDSDLSALEAQREVTESLTAL